MVGDDGPAPAALPNLRDFAEMVDLMRRQLDQLGRELGVVLTQAEAKAAKINILLGQARVLPPPKSIRPLAASKRKTPKRRAKIR